MRPATIWLRIVRGPSPSDTHLEVEYPLLDDVQLYAHDGQGRPYTMAQGDLLPFAQRPFLASTLVFPLRPGTRDPLLLRVRSTSSLLISTRLHTPQEIFRAATTRNLLFGIYFGFLILIAAYNAVLLLSTRDTTFGFYSLYVALTCLTFLCMEGYAYQYLWPKAVEWNNVSFVFVSSMAFAAALEFAKRYLQIRWTNSRWRFGSLTLMQLAYVVFGFLMAVVSYRTFSSPYNAMVGVSCIIVLAIVFHSALSGFRPARYFAIAWTLFLSGMICFSLRFAGVIPDTAVTHGLGYVGSALEVLLLSLGLGDRINQMRREREDAQRATLDQQLRLTASFERFVPKQFLTLLNQPGITAIRLGDSVEKTMTIMFSDIRSFTTLTESMTSADSFAFVNALLRRIGPVIRHNGGFIDKYIGDAIMALFPDSPDDALRASIEMRGLLQTYNESRTRQGLEAIAIGIGIHTGNLMLGTIGEEERLEGTVISDNVNLASRLEGLTKQYGVTTLISGQTLFNLAQPDAFQYRIVDYVRVKGKSESISVLEVIDGDVAEQRALKQATRGRFERAIAAYQDRRFEEAASSFDQVRQQNPGDSVALMYANRIRTFREHGLPPDWDGISQPDKK